MVAAVSGTPPIDLQNHIQQGLDELHQLFFTELSHFNGDLAPFVGAEPHLRSCLLSELTPKAAKRKSPYLAWTAISLIVLPLFYWLFTSWQLDNKINAIYGLAEPAGIHLESVEMNQGTLVIKYLRDPMAVPADQWIEAQNLQLPNVIYQEKLFASLAPEIIKQKVDLVLAGTNVNYSIENNELVLMAGNLYEKTPQVVSALLSIPGILAVNSNALDAGAKTGLSSAEQQQLLINMLTKALNNNSIVFASKSATLSNAMMSKVDQLAKQIKQLNHLSTQQEKPLGIILTGYSDNSGNSQQNLVLSQQRAEQVKKHLVNKGVSADILHAVGAGEMPFTELKQAARSVVFSVVNISSAQE